MTVLTLDISAQVAAADQAEMLALVQAQGCSTIGEMIQRVIGQLKTAPLINSFALNAEKIVDENGNARLNYSGVIAARWEDEQGILHLAINNGDIVKVLPYKG